MNSSYFLRIVWCTFSSLMFPVFFLTILLYLVISRSNKTVVLRHHKEKIQRCTVRWSRSITEWVEAFHLSVNPWFGFENCLNILEWARQPSCYQNWLLDSSRWEIFRNGKSNVPNTWNTCADLNFPQRNIDQWSK